MGNRGEWHRWGRGMCEGYSLEIGFAYIGQIVRHDTVGEPPAWQATINGRFYGDHPDREAAMRRVEQSIESDMAFAIGDFDLYQAAKARRKTAA